MKSKPQPGYAAQGTGNASTSTVDNVELANLEVPQKNGKKLENTASGAAKPVTRIAKKPATLRPDTPR
ncbi:hypothetical protein [Rhodoferax sp.]|uniref:hypothetical protein n=1 Tax=Rhodoferax sp. TaxID=50421 RepID=UPI00374CC542